MTKSIFFLIRCIVWSFFVTGGAVVAHDEGFSVRADRVSQRTLPPREDRKRAARGILLRISNHGNVPVAIVVERHEPVCVVPEQSFLGARIEAEDVDGVRVTVTRRFYVVAPGGSHDIVGYSSTLEQLFITRMVGDMRANNLLEQFKRSTVGWQGPYQCLPIAEVPGEAIAIHLTFDRGEATHSVIQIDSDRALIASGVASRFAQSFCTRRPMGSNFPEEIPIAHSARTLKGALL